MRLEPPWNILLGELKLIQVNDGTVVAVFETDTKRYWQLSYFASKAYQQAALIYPTINNLVFLDEHEIIDDANGVDLVGIARR